MAVSSPISVHFVRRPFWVCIKVTASLPGSLTSSTSFHSKGSHLSWNNSVNSLHQLTMAMSKTLVLALVIGVLCITVHCQVSKTNWFMFVCDKCCDELNCVNCVWISLNSVFNLTRKNHVRFSWPSHLIGANATALTASAWMEAVERWSGIPCIRTLTARPRWMRFSSSTDWYRWTIGNRLS